MLSSVFDCKTGCAIGAENNSGLCSNARSSTWSTHLIEYIVNWLFIFPVVHAHKCHGVWFYRSDKTIHYSGNPDKQYRSICQQREILGNMLLSGLRACRVRSTTAPIQFRQQLPAYRKCIAWRVTCCRWSTQDRAWNQYWRVYRAKWPLRFRLLAIYPFHISANWTA